MTDTANATKKEDQSARIVILQDRLPASEHFFQNVLDLLFLVAGKIPVERLLEAFTERRLRFPTEEFFCEAIIGDAIDGPARHVRPQANLGLFAGIIQNHLGRFENLYAFHGAKIDSSSVVDFFRAEDRAFDDVIDV